MRATVKCLLVDDFEENLTSLSALLQHDDVEILCANSGAKALDLLLQHDVALALLDVQMPEMDGFQLAELMRGSDRTKHVPLIFVTAGSRDQYRHFKGYEAGAVDFLYKPVDPHILRSKAGIFFQLHRQKLQLAQELRDRSETLRLNEMFVAVLGHDLRNPLNAVMMSAHVMQRAAKDDLVRDAATRILSSGDRMTRMIEDLLDLARARLAGGIPLQRERIDLGTLVPRVVQELSSAYPNRRIEVSPEGDLVGEWDADRLAQVVSNLLGNALQYGIDARPVRVRLDGARADSVSLSVSNDGTIPEELLPSVFDPFRRRVQHSANNTGLGLGLFIVKQIVEAHGGSVDVHSDESEGTTFSAVMPRRSVG